MTIVSILLLLTSQEGLSLGHSTGTTMACLHTSVGRAVCQASFSRPGVEVPLWGLLRHPDDCFCRGSGATFPWACFEMQPCEKTQKVQPICSAEMETRPRCTASGRRKRGRERQRVTGSRPRAPHRKGFSHDSSRGTGVGWGP